MRGAAAAGTESESTQVAPGRPSAAAHGRLAVGCGCGNLLFLFAAAPSPPHTTLIEKTFPQGLFPRSKESFTAPRSLPTGLMG